MKPFKEFKDKGKEAELKELLRERVLVLDGAMGTTLQDLGLKLEDFGGAEFEGCNEHLNLTCPEIVRKVHAGYLEAGADIVETNTFGGIRHVLAEYALQDRTLEINRKAAELAAEEARRFSTPDRPRFVGGALGPGTKMISVTGGITFDRVRRNYAEAARGLIEGGADLLFLETQQDTLNAKASILGIHDSFEALGRSVPIVLTVSIEPMGTMLAGQTTEALYVSVKHLDLLGVGLNCATGPDFMTDHLRTLASLSRFAVVCYPNAGLPDEHGHYHESPEMVAAKLRRFCEEGWINIAGGCCGTSPAHIRAISEAVRGIKPRSPVTRPRAAASGLEALDLDQDRRPILVGERTNVIGSKKFREMIAAEKYEEAAEVGRKQARRGGQIIDVCLANPDRDESEDMARFLDVLTRKVRVPLMIDSTDSKVIEEALKRSPGKAVINSINLEDGEERFRQVVPLARRYGAAVIVGTIDEDKNAGMAVTRERKLAIARRSHDLLTGEFGLPPEDIIFDPLTFPCATGDKNYYGSALETIEGIRLIKAALPDTKTLLGVSNVSFGLPKAGREALNAVFLHHCVEAGLDLAIVNTQRLARYATLDDKERSLSERVLFWKGPGDPAHPEGFDPVAEFAAHFKTAKPKAEAAEEIEKLPPEERVARRLVEGSKENLQRDLDELLKSLSPLEIINGPLMRGMDEVGRLFGANELIVTEVLQSAEVMKAAVSHLEPMMDKSSSASRGKVLLATVKGDVHDIGKNLVHIILANNGYEIADLGIKVAPEAVIRAAKELEPDIIGLSGLLVKSAQQMAVTAQDLAGAGIKTPILVGGAALSPKFTASRIAPAYPGPVLHAKDAMTGLDLANRLTDPESAPALVEENSRKQEKLAGAAAPAPRGEVSSAKPVPIRHDHAVPAPPDLMPRVMTDFQLEDVFGYINPLMLYGKHLGLKGNMERLISQGDPKARELLTRMWALQDEVREKRLIRPKAVIRFFPAQGEGEDLIVYDPDGEREIERFRFPRQPSGERLCLSDFVLPKSTGRMDYVAFFVVTAGAGIAELARRWRNEGSYVKSHALGALAIESAEALAERLHEQMRNEWGIPDPADMTLKEKFQAKYRGVRVSFGYPACPFVEDQTRIWRLLDPEKAIGVKLTEGFMMDPEASVSALVFHHPQARYFSAGRDPAGERNSAP